MKSGIFDLGGRDVVNSIISTIFAAVVVALAGVVGQPGFDVFTVDWHTTISLIINVSLATFVGDMARRFTTDDKGKLFGKI